MLLWSQAKVSCAFISGVSALAEVVACAQLKIMQEVITLSVFVPFAILYMHQRISWDFLGAGLCLIGAVAFIFL